MLASTPMQGASTLSVEQVLAALRRRWWVIVLTACVVGAATFAYTQIATKQYTATASISFALATNEQSLAGLTSQPTTVLNPEANLEQVELGNTAAQTAAAVGHGLSAQDVRNMLAFSVPNQTTNVVSVAATSPSKTLATEVANTYTRIFVRGQQTTDQQYYQHALGIVTAQLARLPLSQRNTSTGLALQARVQSLGLLSELRSTNVQVAQLATLPVSPSSPRTKRDTALGLFIGLLVGLALAFLLERIDNVARDPREFEASYGLPLLGVIPASPNLAKSTTTPDGNPSISSYESEAFQLVHAHLRYFNVDRQLRTVLVTSSTPGDGKTTLSTHLAAAAARLGSNVLLVEADLRLPTIARQLGIRPDPGLSEVLIGGAVATDAIQTVDVQSTTQGEAGRPATLDVLIAGSTTPPNPAALIQSRAMSAVLDYAKDNYDLIVVDTPPITAVSDAFSLLSDVDGVIVVGRVGHDKREAIRRASESLQRAAAPLLGVVVNYVKRSNDSYYYSNYGGD